MKPFRLRLEHGQTFPDRVCITESAAPDISWALAGKTGDRQTAYRVEVTSGCSVLWDTGWIASSKQNTKYTGEPLLSGEVYTLRVCVKDAEEIEGEPAIISFCPGSLEKWPALWLSADETREDAVVSYVKDVALEKEVSSACLFAATTGYHKIYINGQAVYTKPMNPATSEYEKRSYYTVLPGLESVLRKGANRIGINAATGWRSPHHVCFKLVSRVADFAGPTQVSAALRVRFSDGSVKWFITDESWEYFLGGTVYSNIFIGENFEADRSVSDWSVFGTPLKMMEPTASAEAPCEKLVPQTLEPVCEAEVYPALSVCEVAPGVYGVDFGQNLAGVCRIRVPTGIKRGERIEMQHCEALDENARLYMLQMRGAKSIDTYTASGDGKDLEYFQPEYTYHGFRYVEVSGYPQSLLKEDICAVSLYSDVKSSSMFSCGSAIVNAIQKMVVQTEKANIHSILTDCPQRDERQGWMNDATVRFEETPYNFDVGRLFPKVVRDLMDVQSEDGAITCTAPFAFGARPADPVCSSFLIAGWESYMHTGNADILGEAYGGWKAWNELLESKSEDYIVQYSYYGDWASPQFACEDNEDSAISGVTPGILMSTGYFYFNAKLLAEIAHIIGKDCDVQYHSEKAEKIREAFLRKWWDEKTGKVATGSQACQSFALWLDILPEAGRKKAIGVLHDDLFDRGYQITTGNLCTRYLFDVLTRFGYIEDAWAVITREDYPSYGYMLQNEATTVWERFELKKSPWMNSHNHPMYGAVGYWFYAYLAGVRPLAPAWKEFSVRPYIPQKLNSANSVVATPLGDVTVRWVKRYGHLHIYVGVPVGTVARVSLPWELELSVGGGFHHWAHAL